MTLGEYIKAYRAMHGMSQRKFAALSGLTNTYISNLERGVNSNGSITTPSLETYQAVAKATGCEAADLIALLDDPGRDSKDPADAKRNQQFSRAQQQLIDLFPDLTEADVDVLLATAQAQANSHKLQGAKQ